MSLARLREHRRIWDGKPVLQDVYAVWFDALTAALRDARQVLEVGAGPGFLARHARGRLPGVRWLAQDVLETPWNDFVGDAERLPLAGGSLDAVAALDVLHHLGRPARFFAEARRVLRAGGQLAALEPWVTPLSFPVYRWLHQEGCRPSLDPWDPFPGSAEGGKDAFGGDAAVVWRIVRTTPAAEWARLGFAPPRVTLFNGFAYLASLGFRDGSLLPRRAAPLLARLDRMAAPLAPLTAMRALAVWRRT